MGNTVDKEEMTEYLDENPGFLQNYVDRNPELLDRYVIDNVDELTVKQWLEKVKDPPPSDVLKVLKLDYLKPQNLKRHHTEKYINKDLVVRRADTFLLDIIFKNRAFLPAKDSITLEFSIGSNPTTANGTKIKVPVKKLIVKQWSANIDNQDDDNKKVSLVVNIPFNAIIGSYKLSITVGSEMEGGVQKETTARQSVIVIFNPFSPGDVCYMEESAHLQEYVLEDKGLLYSGTKGDIDSYRWAYSQFDENILNIALKLMRENPTAKQNPVKSVKKRASPVYCSRVLSAMINSADDNGVLVGRWDGKYADGRSPSTWSNSAAILREWNKEKKSVKYGQCWVFAGVLTTVLRAIGIPTRPVTNFQSAHDTDFTMTIDRFFDEDGEPTEHLDIDDSVWNFHVWNETWFARPDLVPGYDGWQAVDATPQERSEGVMQCGPCPIKAIKKGEVYIGKDTEFIFSEVNADIVQWKVNKEGEVTGMMKRIKGEVGREISTKSVGTNEREDVTDHYKYKEGSPEEREAFKRAFAHGVKKEWHDNFMTQEDTGIVIDIKPVGEAINGQDVKLQIGVTSTSGQSAKVYISTVIYSVLNTGKRNGFIKRVKKEAMVGKDQQTLTMPFSDYGSLLVDENVVSVITTVKIANTTKLFVETYDLKIKSPDCITIIGGENMPLNQYNFDVYFSITNVLPVTLTDGVFYIEGPGIYGDLVKASRPIAPGETYTTSTIQILAFREGEVDMVADFDAAQIKNVKAYKTGRVVDPGW